MKLYSQSWLIFLAVLLLLGYLTKPSLVKRNTGIFEKAQKVLNVAPEDIVSISPQDLYDLTLTIFDTKLTDLQREENWKKFQGKYVVWKGQVKEINPVGQTYLGKFLHKHEGGGYIYVHVLFGEGEKEKLLRLHCDDIVPYAGLLEFKKQAWFWDDYHFFLIDGHLIEAN